MEELKFYNEWEPYGELCNYYVRDMVIDGVTWPAVEHYYQAQGNWLTTQSRKK